MSEHFCSEHPETRLICERCKAAARIHKLPADHFSKMGRKSRKPLGPAGLQLRRVMAIYNVSRGTARRLIKLHGKQVERCTICHHNFSEHVDGRCPKRKPANSSIAMQKISEEGTAIPSSFSDSTTERNTKNL